MKKLAVFFALYLLALIQVNFLIHFSGFSERYFIYGFILIVVILLNLLDEQFEKRGIFIAGLIGFFLDIFSDRIFGLGILILIGIAILLKIIKNRVTFPSSKIIPWTNILKTKN